MKRIKVTLTDPERGMFAVSIDGTFYPLDIAEMRKLSEEMTKAYEEYADLMVPDLPDDKEDEYGQPMRPKKRRGYGRNR